MAEIEQTEAFAKWLTGLKDSTAVAKIVARIQRLGLGNPGDARSVGGGVVEMRIDHGPGYRVYYTQKGSKLVILLCGGDKKTQTRDIRRAKGMI